jgi:hypothetical protein
MAKEAVDQGERAQNDADPVDPPGPPIRSLGHEEQRHEEGHGTEEQVEPEDGVPTPQPDQHAADDRAEGQGQAGDGRPHPQRVGPGAPVRVDVADDGEGPGLRGGGPQAHDDAAADQHVDVGGQRGHNRTGAEDRHAGQHDLLAAEDVAQRSPRQHEGSERQGVAVDDPLQRCDAGMQAALDVGQPDAHHCVVQEGQEQDEAQRGQGHRLGPGSETALFNLHAGHGTADGGRDAVRRHRNHPPGRLTGPVYPLATPRKPLWRRAAPAAPRSCDNGRRQPPLQRM